MTVSEVINYYHLADVKKTYKDVYGQPYPLPNIEKLTKLPVKDFYLNLKINKAEITVLGIEDI